MAREEETLTPISIAATIMNSSVIKSIHVHTARQILSTENQRCSLALCFSGKSLPFSELF